MQFDNWIKTRRLLAMRLTQKYTSITVYWRWDRNIDIKDRLHKTKWLYYAAGAFQSNDIIEYQIQRKITDKIQFIDGDVKL